MKDSIKVAISALIMAGISVAGIAGFTSWIPFLTDLSEQAGPLVDAGWKLATGILFFIRYKFNEAEEVVAGAILRRNKISGHSSSEKSLTEYARAA